MSDWLSAVCSSDRGGRIDTANGQPSGVCVDAATDLIAAVVPRPLARDLDRAFLLAQARLLEQGITTIADMGTTIEDWQAYRRAGDKHSLAIRIISYGDDIDNMALIGGSGPTPGL